MSLLKYLVQGFGWKVGAEAAAGALKKANDELTKESPEEAEARRARRAAEDERRRVEEERRRAEELRQQREQAKREKIAKERAVEQELAELKKRVARGKGAK